MSHGHQEHVGFKEKRDNTTHRRSHTTLKGLEQLTTLSGNIKTRVGEQCQQS